jgi:hypothetical protein
LADKPATAIVFADARILLMASASGLAMVALSAARLFG